MIRRPPRFTLFPPRRSPGPIAVAPGSVNPPWHSTISGFAPLRIIWGGVVSTTLTIRVLVAQLPVRSGTRLSFGYVHVSLAVSDPLVTTLRVPAQRSIAVAPG